ncbi:PI-PLC X domain-containing protein 1 [Hypsizygus marmoreus]|uniref:PI-PLC X domain-containing protein 1 n=1 Tax=Hypsizygus marmoreus TaxID=39966 RepID=A0A369J7X7_HYPMA|nr:PI-PLC X domain-containing protein 1 [Hypsizygus marmoreus]
MDAMRPRYVTLLLILLFVSPALGAWLPWFASKRASVCNGHSELCSRPYGNTTFLAAHNSFAFSMNPLALARTQEVDVAAQLKLGVRMLQGQAHMMETFTFVTRLVYVPMEVMYCVYSLIFASNQGLFDGGTVEDYLKKVKTFLDANPNEVLTFIFTNPERLSLPDIWKPAFDNAGVTPFAYIPPSRPVRRNDWPTLGQLIDQGKRVIVFLDAGADGSAGGIVDFILPQFEMVWEDPFSPTDANFPCRVDRSTGPLSTDQHLNLINHNLNVNIIPIGDGVLISDRANAPTTNSVNSILAHANGCASFASGRAPNFVLLDYVNTSASTVSIAGLILLSPLYHFLSL